MIRKRMSPFTFTDTLWCYAQYHSPQPYQQCNCSVMEAHFAAEYELDFDHHPSIKAGVFLLLLPPVSAKKKREKKSKRKGEKHPP